MISWIKGQDLLESPHKFTKQELFKFVQEGVLVPYCSPDADWIKKYELTVPGTERIWRFFPTPELQKKWVMEVFLKKGKLEEAQDWLTKSDEEHIEDHKHDLNLDWDGAPPKYLVDLETFIDCNLPLLRQKYLQITQDYPSQIKNLEKEFAPNLVWRNLDLGPTQQEALTGKLLDALYQLEQVEAILGAKSKIQSVAATKSQKTKSYATMIKKKVIAKAKVLWEKEPTITIADMAYTHLTDIAKKKDGAIYAEVTIRKWIKEFCPNRRQGRRPIK